MTQTDDVLRAAELYASGDDHELLSHASEFWARHGSTGAGAAELARFARIAAFRAGAAESDLWQARAISAACQTGAWRSLALSLQPHFYKLVGSGELDAAEQVLDEMASLASSDHADPPERDLVDGILSERRALLFAERGDWPRAAEWYRTALALCPAGDRRELKVKGGLARSEWLGGGTDSDAVAAFESLETLAEPFPDVHEAARENLAAARVGDRARSVPFDLI